MTDKHLEEMIDKRFYFDEQQASGIRTKKFQIRQTIIKM